MYLFTPISPTLNLSNFGTPLFNRAQIMKHAVYFRVPAVVLNGKIISKPG